MSCATCERIRPKVQAELTRMTPMEITKKVRAANALADWIKLQHRRDDSDHSPAEYIAELL